MASPYDQIIADTAAKFRIPVALLDHVVRQESGYDPHATSPAGAQGLTQLMPDTAKALGVTDPYDPAQSVEGGAKYLREQLDRFHTPALALAAYNAGPGAVEKYGGVPPFAETQNYVKSILAGLGDLSSPPPATVPGGASTSLPGPRVGSAPATSLAFRGSATAPPRQERPAPLLSPQLLASLNANNRLLGLPQLNLPALPPPAVAYPPPRPRTPTTAPPPRTTTAASAPTVRQPTSPLTAGAKPFAASVPKAQVVPGGVIVHGSQAPARIVLHDTESLTDPYGIADFWRKQGLGYGAHFVIAPDGRVVQFAKPTDLVWHVGGANHGAIGIEMDGLAKWSRAEWLQHPAELEAVATTIASLAVRYRIPITLNTDRGISTHAMQSKLHPESEGHTDPGPGFPLDLVLARAKTLASARRMT